MPDKSLPLAARNFMQTSRGVHCKSQVRQFHDWLKKKNKTSDEITSELVMEHLSGKLKTILPKTGRVYKCQLLSYLDYLYSKNKINFDPEHLRIRPTPQPLPDLVQRFMASREKAYGASTLRLFHKWLQMQSLPLKELTGDAIGEYLDQRARKLSSPSVGVDRNQLLVYLEFLYNQNKIHFDPSHLRIKVDPYPLPDLAHLYLQSPKGTYSKTNDRKFHRWLQEREVKLPETSVELVDNYLKYRSKELSAVSWTAGKNQLIAYLDFLFKSKAIGFDPVVFRPEPKTAPLPELARDFLSNYSAMVKESTVLHYVSSLRRFYSWLNANSLQLAELEPIQLENFAKWMKERGLHAATRNSTLICLRVYFRWLNEHKILSNDADILIKAKVFPKLPRYLPRPYPPKTDHVIRQRLAESQNLYHDGLLLMRNTGLRISELTNLAIDCLQHDHDQNFYLKVPLGKLNNERLVPIDETTLKLIRKLQQSHTETSKFLLETKRGKKTRTYDYSKALKEVCTGLDLQGPAHTHRLRHTFATTMLNGGMSLVGLMKILGHSDHRMTLRYSAITTETVKDEYDAALKKLANRYKDIYLPDKNQDEHPKKKVKDIIKWLQKNAQPVSPAADKKVASIIKRLRALEADLANLKIVPTNF